jgi:hypothetical protein
MLPAGAGTERAGPSPAVVAACDEGVPWDVQHSVCDAWIPDAGAQQSCASDATGWAIPEGQGHTTASTNTAVTSALTVVG